MGYQTLQFEDDQGNVHNLGDPNPDGGVSFGIFDKFILDAFKQKGWASNTAVGSVNSPGTVVVKTPAAGSSLRIKWIRFKSIGNSGTNKFTLKLGANTLYSETLDELDAWQHGAVHEGGVDEALTLETTASQYLEYNIEYEEF